MKLGWSRRASEKHVPRLFQDLRLLRGPNAIDDQAGFDRGLIGPRELLQLRKLLCNRAPGTPVSY